MNRTKLLAAAMVCCCAGVMSASARVDPMDAMKDKAKEAMKDGKKAVQDAMKKGEPGKDGMPAMSESMQAEMKAMMEAGTPGEMHKWMAKMTGDWTATIKAFVPGMPESTDTGTMKVSMLFDGHYSRSHMKSTFMGQPFEGVGTLGFNNTTGKFESTWVDSMSTMTMMSTGSLDKATNTLTMTGQSVDCLTKKNAMTREVTTFKNDNEWGFVMYMTKEGEKEAKVMEINYVRSAGKPGKMDDEKMDKKMAPPAPGTPPGKH